MLTPLCDDPEHSANHTLKMAGALDWLFDIIVRG